MKQLRLIIGIVMVALGLAVLFFVLPRIKQEAPPIDYSDFVDTSKPAETEVSKIMPKQVLLNVPFTSQAPTFKWDDARFQDGCEEASVFMAMKWVKGETITVSEAEKEILALSDWQQERYNNFRDTSANDTVARLFNIYYKYENVTVRKSITVDDIKQSLAQGKLVLIPADGI